MERKPDVCVYVNAAAHERDIRTCVRDINTQLSHMGVAGPNLEVHMFANLFEGKFQVLKETFRILSYETAHDISRRVHIQLIYPDQIISVIKLISDNISIRQLIEEI